MMQKKYATGDVDLSGFLNAKNEYLIPDYQRSYDWEQEKVEDLWRDLMQIYVEEVDIRDKAYFLGPIVTLEPEPHDAPHEIIDGQQRLVTLTLMLCAFRDLLRNNMEKLNDDINDLILDIEQHIPRSFKLQHADEIFSELLQGEFIERKNNEIADDNERTLIKNYKILVKNLEELFDKCGLYNTDKQRISVRRLRKIIEDLMTKTQFAHITVKDREYTIQVFQSLNSKGQTLNQSDLVKSHVLAIVNPKKRQDVEERWDRILDALGKDEDPDEFLYESALSRSAKMTKDIQKKELFKYVKKNMSTEKNVTEYIKGLKIDVNYIRNLNDPKRVNEKCHELKHSLYGLKQIRARYVRRPIIAACREWGLEDSKTTELITCLLKFFFVYRTICEGSIDQIKKNSKEITGMIMDGNNSLNEIFWTILKDSRPEQPVSYVKPEEFIEKFLDAAYYLKEDAIKYILYSFERDLILKKGMVEQVNAYELEHIFPRKATKKYWPKRDELKRGVSRLGNITLVPPDWNKKLSNHSFKYKMENGYKKSGIKLNKEYLQKYNDWDLKSMADREKNLINDLAKKVWDLSEYENKAKKPHK